MAPHGTSQHDRVVLRGGGPARVSVAQRQPPKPHPVCVSRTAVRTHCVLGTKLAKVARLQLMLSKKRAVGFDAGFTRVRYDPISYAALDPFKKLSGATFGAYHAQ